MSYGEVSNSPQNSPSVNVDEATTEIKRKYLIEERKRLQRLLEEGNESWKRIKELQEEVSGFSSTESHCVELNFLCVFQLGEKSHTNNTRKTWNRRRYRGKHGWGYQHGQGKRTVVIKQYYWIGVLFYIIYLLNSHDHVCVTLSLKNISTMVPMM